MPESEAVPAPWARCERAARDEGGKEDAVTHCTCSERKRARRQFRRDSGKWDETQVTAIATALTQTCAALSASHSRHGADGGRTSKQTEVSGGGEDRERGEVERQPVKGHRKVKGILTTPSALPRPDWWPLRPFRGPTPRIPSPTLLAGPGHLPLSRMWPCCPPPTRVALKPDQGLRCDPETWV